MYFEEMSECEISAIENMYENVFTTKELPCFQKNFHLLSNERRIRI